MKFNPNYAKESRCVRCGETKLVWVTALCYPIRCMDNEDDPPSTLKYTTVEVCKECSPEMINEWREQMDHADELIYQLR